MYFKLALKNVRKSYKDYLIYFITLAFSVCLFYSFNSFQEQKAVLMMNEFQDAIIDDIVVIMGFVSLFVVITLSFLILYANNFLIKRRKKEFGLYTLLGMHKKHISRVIIYETLFIGILSLLTGIFLGIVLSQYLTVVTASLFTVDLDYHFVFSVDATILTILAFSSIFILTMFLNTLVLNRYKLIDLINADRKNEMTKGRNLYVSIIIFIISIIMIGYTYYLGISSGMAFITRIFEIFLIGGVGTILFFMSLSGFLLKFVQSSKKFYFRNLNMFVLRQINAKINSNFLSMSIVCLMLLMSIAALSTGISLKNNINSTVELTTPFDYSYKTREVYAEDTINAYGFDLSYVKEVNTMEIYNDENNVSPILSKLFEGNPNFDPSYDLHFELMKLSSFNENLVAQGKEPISVKKGEAYLYTTTSLLDEYVFKMLEEEMEIPVFGDKVKITNKDFIRNNLSTSLQIGSISFGVVVDDSLIPQDAVPLYSFWNANLKSEDKIDDFRTMATAKINDYFTINESSYIFSDQYGSFKDTVEANSIGMSVMFTYIGIYLGVVFIVASAVILALQQLAQADENRSRYAILNKIGAEKKMLNHSVFMQIAIYFFIPLALALVHSFVGIQAISSIVMVFGNIDITGSSLITMMIILSIYALYFYVTYTTYKRILYK